jgi:hypothetical protein
LARRVLFLEKAPEGFLKGFRFPLLEKQGPQVRLVPGQKHDLQQGIGLGPPGGALQGEVEVLKQAVDPGRVRIYV